MKFSDLKIGDKFTSAEGMGANEVVWTKLNNMPGGIENCESSEYGKGVCGKDEFLTLVSRENPVKKFDAKIVGRDSLTVFVGGQVYSASSSHLNYGKLKDAVENNDVDAFLAAHEVLPQTLVGDKGIKVENGEVTYNGVVLHNTLCTRLLELIRAGKDVESLTKFLENLMKNPSSRTINELYDFLENKCLPITDDGHFLAYKSVSSDFYSKTAGKLTLLQGSSKNGRIFNGVGETIECPRNQVDDERRNECSYGLHAGGLAYSGVGGTFHSSGDKCLIVKINPADVIAVPQDYNAQKLRTCKYVVVGEFKGSLNKPVYNTGEDYSHDDDYYDDEDCDNFDDFVDDDDLSDGDCINFKYHGESRTAEILSIHYDHIHTKLLNPEEKVGEYRNFKLDDMSEITFV